MAETAEKTVEKVELSDLEAAWEKLRETEEDMAKYKAARKNRDEAYEVFQTKISGMGESAKFISEIVGGFDFSKVNPEDIVRWEKAKPKITPEERDEILRDIGTDKELTHDEILAAYKEKSGGGRFLEKTLKSVFKKKGGKWVLKKS